MSRGKNCRGRYSTVSKRGTYPNDAMFVRQLVACSSNKVRTVPW